MKETVYCSTKISNLNFVKSIARIIICALFSVTAIAQEYSISGIVQDDNYQPIPYSNIIVSEVDNPESQKGAISDESGLFNIEELEVKTYVLEISFLGFESHHDTITITQNVNLKTIILKEKTQELDGVTVIAKRPTVKRTTDRLVFNVENSTLSESSVLDVLKHTPGVLINNEKITVRNSTPTVYINDRKVHLSTNEIQQLLEGKSATNVKSIEVITNPPAKYDAESGIVLNIVTSRNLVSGYRGTVFANYTQGVYPRYNAGITNFYKTEKINVFASYSYKEEKIAREVNEKINFLDNDNSIVERWDSNFDRNRWSRTHNVNLNFDFFADDNNTFSFSSNILYLPYFKYITNGQTNVLDPSFNPIYNFNNENISNIDNHNIGLDLDYDHEFNDDNKISVNTHFTTYDYSRDQNVKSSYFDANNNFDFDNEFSTASNQKTNIFTAQIDYDLTINESSSFSTGVKGSFINTDNEINQYNVINGVSTFNVDDSNAFNYNEDIYAAYADYKKSWERWSLSFGLRAEQTNAKGKSIVTNNEQEQNYFNWFPTASIGFQASEKISLYSNYKRSINRPNFKDLNPFKLFLNDNTVITGNPNLQPALTDHIVVGISLNNHFFFEAYYKDTQASFMELPLQDNEDNLIVYTPTNLSSTTEYGFDLLAFFDITKNWSVYAATSFYNLKDLATINNEVLEKDTWSNYSEMSNSFTFLKDNSLTASLSIIYVSDYQEGFQSIDSRTLSDIAIKKTILNKRGSITLSASDLFNKQDYGVVSKYLNQDNSRYLNEDNRYVKLAFSYRFGNIGLETNERTKDHKARNRLEK